MKKIIVVVAVLGLLVMTGCGVAGSCEGQVGGKTSGSANIANPVK